jgi:hypothetical protein
MIQAASDFPLSLKLAKRAYERALKAFPREEFALNFMERFVAEGRRLN